MDQIHTPQPVALPALEGDDDLDDAILFPKRVRSAATLTLVPPVAAADPQEGVS